MGKRAIFLVMDSVGIGELPDADQYGDQGSHTLGHTAEALGGLALPVLASLGLGRIAAIAGVPAVAQPQAAYGKMAERSPGKDTTTGHWELAGLILEQAFPVYPQGFPAAIIDAFEQAIGRKTLGNVAASGTEIIQRLGADHERTGYPIVYTSADSVFQIAAHEEVIPLEDLYRYCETARQLLTGAHAVGRVIARPFTGKAGAYVRTANRHDYSLQPPGPLMLERVQEAGMTVAAVGKMADIYAGRGITERRASRSNREGIDQTLALMGEVESGLILTNLVDFDMLFGHRNDPVGYGRALEDFDRRLPAILAALRPDDLLVITADHGCDPTTASTDHSREYVPVFLAGSAVQPVDVGTRTTFADVGETILAWLGLKPLGTGAVMRVWR
ncbi:phosphopentomutase [Heliophilum fasciatum]|uniref:Phosphopentomutase n=1 Tax=Heliophilum fasciatum TaxID=35700 RepID=A0A4V2SXS4_9FIRM|nr:phosphopentomutase [Heliophilum fasciatum]MCW2277360.1 phosphopentomutase [Heliophilum fasciatum]TCP67196.1 phosphopentomutase [Heliophilum fasciatum]